MDELLSKNGIEALRLPPYHCHYKTFEIVWGFCKMYYNKHILQQSSKRSDVEKLWNKELSKYSPAMSENSVNHCENIASVQNISSNIISLAESDDESTSASSDSDSEGGITFDDERI